MFWRSWSPALWYSSVHLHLDLQDGIIYYFSKHLNFNFSAWFMYQKIGNSFSLYKSMLFITYIRESKGDIEYFMLIVISYLTLFRWGGGGGEGLTCCGGVAGERFNGLQSKFFYGPLLLHKPFNNNTVSSKLSVCWLYIDKLGNCIWFTGDLRKSR